jgi:hypothetical protein
MVPASYATIATLDGLSAAQRRPNTGEQLFNAERFGDEVICARVERFNFAYLVRQRRQDQDWYTAERAQAPAHLDAIDTWHSQIEQHHVRPLLRDGVETHGAIRSGAQAVAASFEDRFERLQKLWLVVDCQDRWVASVAGHTASGSVSTCGMSTTNRAPPNGFSSTHKRPPCDSTAARAIARPRPAPGLVARAAHTSRRFAGAPKAECRVQRR